MFWELIVEKLLGEVVSNIGNCLFCIVEVVCKIKEIDIKV